MGAMILSLVCLLAILGSLRTIVNERPSFRELASFLVVYFTVGFACGVSVWVVLPLAKKGWLGKTVVVLVLPVIYCGTFSYWWLTSPSEEVTWKNGSQGRVVAFQFNRVSWHTHMIWLPAFWFMEKVVGYEAGGFAAMGDESIQEYLK